MLQEDVEVALLARSNALPKEQSQNREVALELNKARRTWVGIQQHLQAHTPKVEEREEEWGETGSWCRATLRLPVGAAVCWLQGSQLSPIYRLCGGGVYATGAVLY